MNCLNNRIGIKGCGAPATAGVTADPNAFPPVIGVEALPILFINSLPGVTLENISALVDEEQETFLGLWSDVVLRTLKKFEVLLRAKVNEYYKITDKVVLDCLVCENVELFDVALWYLHGTELMIERTSTDEMSRFTTIDFDKAERLKEEFNKEFNSAFSDAVMSMEITGSKCLVTCVEERQTLNWIFQTP